MKNKIVRVFTVVIFILFMIGICFVNCINCILSNFAQSSLQKDAEHIAASINSKITGNLDTLSALSKQNFLTETDSNAKVKILNTEAKRKGLLLLAYVDKNGCGLTNDGQTIWFTKSSYFNKALNGNPNISADLVDIPGHQKNNIIYSVPIVKKNKITGVLISAVENDGNLELSNNISVNTTGSVYIISKNGRIISNFNGEIRDGNFLKYIGLQTNSNILDKICDDFSKNNAGKNICISKNTKNIIGYSKIPNTEWMIAVTEKNTVIMSPVNKILVMSGILLLILIFEFLIASFYFIKVKEIKFKTNVRRNAEIEYFTYTDTLTKIPNRKGIKKESKKWIEDCRKNSINGGVYIIDVDNFESVNNTFNHLIGDKFLVEVSNRLSQIVHESDILGRIDGDEFALFISKLNSIEELENFSKTILNTFNDPFIINGNVVKLSCSIGVIPFRVNEFQENECDDLINRGEFALHKAKKALKGRYLIFKKEFNEKFNFQRQMEHELKMSIYNNELTCYYQPQYCNDKKEIVGFEVLARWNSKKFGMVPPANFIPLAEKTGFIKELGHFIVDRTFAFAKSVEGRGVCVSFNVSPIELLQADFTEYIINKFKYYELKPKSVAIEVTESSLIESFDETIKKLHVLKEHGIFVLLDDFGTGFSSLTYLKKLPISLVKIDKSFIDEIVTDNVEKNIVDMIINLAHKLNLDVIAEGVENKEQNKIISKCGCSIIQGYYISPPVSESDAIHLLDVLHK